jgi:CheY-like chemotaxis protein
MSQGLLRSAADRREAIRFLTAGRWEPRLAGDDEIAGNTSDAIVGSLAPLPRTFRTPERPKLGPPTVALSSRAASTRPVSVTELCDLAAILLVDDDELFRTTICRCLRVAGHAVEEAADGNEALKFIAAETPDILITDILMPNTDGIELTSAVKRAHPGVRILVISGRGHLGLVDLLNLASMLGADATLSKPFAPEQLLEKVAALERAT